MGLAVVVLVVAVGAALLFGGTIHRLGNLHLRQPWLVVLAVLAQGGGSLIGVLGFGNASHAYVAGLVLSALCALAFCARNLVVPGVALVTAGLAANALVVGVNGAMPVSIHAAYHARVPIASIAAGNDPRHDIAGIGTHLRWLGDVVPVPFPWQPEVVSGGDVLVAAGLAELVVMGMLGWTRRREPSDGEESTQAARA